MVTSSFAHSACFSCLSPVALASAASPLLHWLLLPLPCCVGFCCLSPVASVSGASPLLRRLQWPLPYCVSFPVALASASTPWFVSGSAAALLIAVAAP